MRTFFIIFLLQLGCLLASPEKDLPVSYLGRFRPAEAYAKLNKKDINTLWQASLSETPSPLETEYKNTLQTLLEKKIAPKEISTQLEAKFPLKERLKQSGSIFKVLPGKNSSAEWYTPKALELMIYDPSINQLALIKNFTLYDDSTFNQLRKNYLIWKQDPSQKTEFTDELYKAYSQIAGTVYLEAYEKSLHYPSLLQLKIERIYFQYPWMDGLLFLYLLALSLFLFSFRKSATAITLIAFILHSALLLARCLILERPPVSNMFETALYVPWIAVATGLILKKIMGSTLAIAAAAFIASALLLVAKWAGLHDSMENVQAVLDSQFWLVIHVLMVVGSYGLFILSGMIGHAYLIDYFFKIKSRVNLSQLILHTMYAGTALLIGGTILGGVWAAESWGRFWDWDPKESWAFISSCTYMIIIHAYRFGKIGDFGLAIGSIAGLLSISFTWYGVNYILGTGLHSYGFGSGGEVYYYIYVTIELLLLVIIGTSYRMFKLTK